MFEKLLGNRGIERIFSNFDQYTSNFLMTTRLSHQVCGTPWIRLTWLWRPSVRRYNRARVSLCTLRKQPFQQTKVRWGDFPLIPNLINYIKFTSRNREACLRCPEVFGPDKHQVVDSLTSDLLTADIQSLSRIDEIQKGLLPFSCYVKTNYLHYIFFVGQLIFTQH